MGVYISVECGYCSEVLLLKGNDFSHARTNTYERSMGREKIHNIELYADCTNCNTEHFAEVDFMEYPENTLQAHYLKFNSKLEYIPIRGLNWLAQGPCSVITTASLS